MADFNKYKYTDLETILSYSSLSYNAPLNSLRKISEYQFDSYISKKNQNIIIIPREYSLQPKQQEQPSRAPRTPLRTSPENSAATSPYPTQPAPIPYIPPSPPPAPTPATAPASVPQRGYIGDVPPPGGPRLIDLEPSLFTLMNQQNPAPGKSDNPLGPGQSKKRLIEMD